MRCRVVLGHLLPYLDGEVDASTRAHIDEHLEECQGCAARAAFEKALKIRIAGLGEATAPAALRRQLKTLIDGL
jgi:mycothiol system anti-sigma-R factor